MATGETDYKSDHKYAEHMKKSGGAASEFAKRRTVLQQRQYLPVFAVREEVSNLIIVRCILTIVAKYSASNCLILGNFSAINSYSG